MTVPGKDALDLALRLVSEHAGSIEHPAELVQSLATAMQELMDERDEGGRDYLALQERCDQWAVRAQRTEAKLADYKAVEAALRMHLVQREREVLEAEAKLAALIAALRQFSREYLQHNRHTLTAADLERLLAKYEGKP